MANRATNRPQSIHSWVASELGNRIVSGVYQPGEYIPNETNLGEELGVSRTALREAFKLLSAKGLIESRPKLGTRIRERKHWNMFDSVLLSWMFDSKPSPKFYESLFEIRKIFEPAAAELAALNHTEEQITVIADAYDKMENAKLGTDEVYSTDVDFHMAILTATNNDFMIALGVTIQTALMGIFRLSSGATNKEYQDALPGHKAIYKAIEAKDPVAAKQQMLVLLDDSQKNLEGTLEQ